MYETGYCHAECDVKGCEQKLNVPVADRDSYGWEIERDVEGTDGTTKKVCLCPEHAFDYRAARDAYAKAVDKLLGGGA